MSPRLFTSIIIFTLAGCDGSDRPTEVGSTVAAVASAAPTLTGRVTHEGAPVADAVVVLASRTTGEAPDLDPASLLTGADGRFALAAPADAYDVLVVGDGLVAEATADLTRGPASLDVALRALDPTDGVQRGALEALVSQDAALGLEPALAEEE